MDMYGLPPSDLFRIDDLLDFSNDDLFSSTTDPDFVHHHHHPPPLSNPVGNRPSSVADRDDTNPNNFPNFPDELGVPSDDVAELEWLSKFVDDSFADIPVNDFAGPTNLRPDASVPGRARSKRSRAASTHNSWTSPPESDILATDNSKTINKKKETSPASSVITGDQSSSSSSSSPLQSGGSALVRKCTHCASEKTPQWRTGPLGPKTLCNACGVRYKSGRLVPEYRPAASPTFVLTQHSNSHRKVLELRRQKEVVRRDSTNHHQFCRHQHHDFKVC